MGKYNKMAQFQKKHLIKQSLVWSVIYSKALYGSSHLGRQLLSLLTVSNSTARWGWGQVNLQSTVLSRISANSVFALRVHQTTEGKATVTAGSSGLISDRLSLSPTSPVLESSEVFHNEQQSQLNRETVPLLQIPANLQSHSLKQARNFMSPIFFPLSHLYAGLRNCLMPLVQND